MKRVETKPGPAPSSPEAPTAPPLDHILNLHDLEEAARKRLSPRAWSYYRSAADAERSYTSNLTMWHKIKLRPRVLRGDSGYRSDTSVLGHHTRSPIMIAPAAMAGLAHPDAEKAICRAAAAHGMIYCVSANASLSPEEIVTVAAPGQVLFYQIYIARDRKRSVQQLERVARLGFKAIVFTVDATTPGKRTLDERQALSTDSEANEVPATKVEAGERLQTRERQSVTALTGGYFDTDIRWSDIAWIRQHSGLPVVVKGITTVEDALLATRFQADALWLSNHGGRQLEDSPTALETLLEIRKHAPHILEKCEVYVDGGIRNGTDVIKALCLGARAVGIGRPMLYALSYGEAGAQRVLQILQEEVDTAARLMGVRRLSQLDAFGVNTKAVDHLISDKVALSKRRRWWSQNAKL